MTESNLPANEANETPAEITSTGSMKLDFGKLFGLLPPHVEAAEEEDSPADGE